MHPDAWPELDTSWDIDEPPPAVVVLSPEDEFESDDDAGAGNA